MGALTRIGLYLRFVRFLLWEFRSPLVVFIGLIFSFGLVLQFGYHKEDLSYVKACYVVFMLIFIQPLIDFPDEWYLQPLFFLLPIVGIGAIADSVVRLAYLFFAKKGNLPEWQRMMVSLRRNHVVVVGAGKLGTRIIRGLATLGEPVVAVEQEAGSVFLDDLSDLGVPIILGNGRHKKTLEQAGVKDARTLVAATNDDLANLDAVLTARELNPRIRAVVRLYDETLSRRFAHDLDVQAISSSHVSAPSFIAAATGRKVYHDFELGGQHLQMTDLSICPTGLLAARRVGDVQARWQVNIVMHRTPLGVGINPLHETILGSGDTILVIGLMKYLIELEKANAPDSNPQAINDPLSQAYGG